MIREGRTFCGVDAVIDKDLASAKLADEVGADLFLIATDVEGATLNFGCPNQKILRGVTLRGIDSVMASQERRQRAWDALAEQIDREQLRQIYETAPLSAVPELAASILQGQVRGRIVIDVNA